MATVTQYKDSYGNHLFEGDYIKIGSLKGYFIVVWDEVLNDWRMKHEGSNSGYGFGIPRYTVKKVFIKQKT